MIADKVAAGDSSVPGESTCANSYSPLVEQGMGGRWGVSGRRYNGPGEVENQRALGRQGAHVLDVVTAVVDSTYSFLSMSGLFSFYFLSNPM